MANKDKNRPVDERWNDTTPLGNMAFNHDFVDGEYVKKDYAHEEYPSTTVCFDGTLQVTAVSGGATKTCTLTTMGAGPC